MVIDTSAIIAILGREPEEPALRDALRVDRLRFMGAATVVEAGLVAQSKWGSTGGRFLDDLIAGLEVEVLAFDATMAAAARKAWARFGKGNHPAALNFGDCLTYAVAEVTGHPILCVGNDFAQSDAALVLGGQG
ncbi:MAG: type II toxin-antitoxin system VapC family toxin [Microthrixaceae bacterium]|nr:type II toxin-antitoxin system VapC family toxin [Acidimicrobiales bacterium]MCB9404761.1 type II toxin-antitoxin system VapC family toxin [Microthrixaceae bacterium]